MNRVSTFRGSLGGALRERAPVTSDRRVPIQSTAVQPARSRWIAIGEAASLATCGALFGRLLVAEGARALEAPLALGFGVLSGAFLADLASGTVHWLCDCFGSERTPLFGRYLIASFREHHRDPHSIGRHGILERSGSNAFAAAAFLAVVSPGIAALEADGPVAFATGGALAAALWSALTNEIHLQAHRADCPTAVRALQRLRLVLPPDHHARHHHGAHDRAYCIATGWSNCLLDRLRMFERLERRLGRSA